MLRLRSVCVASISCIDLNLWQSNSTWQSSGIEFVLLLKTLFQISLKQCSPVLHLRAPGVAVFVQCIVKLCNALWEYREYSGIVRTVPVHSVGGFLRERSTIHHSMTYTLHTIHHISVYTTPAAITISLLHPLWFSQHTTYTLHNTPQMNTHPSLAGLSNIWTLPSPSWTLFILVWSGRAWQCSTILLIGSKQTIFKYPLLHLLLSLTAVMPVFFLSASTSQW